MTILTTVAAFRDELDRARATGRSVGLVPTMGALHAGHRSLVEQAAAECDVVAVSVFVNPLQFDDAGDLDAYPRTLDRDVEVAAGAGAAVVFAPAVTEMYPGSPGAIPTTVHVAGVGDVLEGASRPGHFDGVATVVTKLFSMAGRCRAYFGEKDFQQLALVRQLVDDLSLPVTVVACPIVREADGLALSSRNVRLDAADRRAALVLSKALAAGEAAVLAGERDRQAVEDAMAAVVAAEPRADLDYAAAVDAATLRPRRVLTGRVRLLIAATVGPIRLIDNCGLVVPGPPGSRLPGGDEAAPVGAILRPAATA